MTFVLHDESLNTKGFRMLTSGADLEQLKKNPVMFFLHDDWQLPIGKWENIRVEGTKILADADFDMEDPEAAKIAGKVKRGYLRMASIGAWPPIEVSDDPALMLPGQREATVTKWKAREASIVPIGGNHNSVRLYDENGNLIKDDVPLIELMDKSKSLTPNIFDMKKIAQALNLSDTATENDVLDKVAILLSDNKKLSDEKTELQGKIQTLTDAEMQRKKAEAQVLVSAAKKDGRLNAEGEAKMLAFFDVDFEGAKSVLESIPKRQSVAAQLAASAGKKYAEGRDDWSFMDWMKKDPKGLQAMKANEPEAYYELRDNYKSNS